MRPLEPHSFNNVVSLFHHEAASKNLFVPSIQHLVIHKIRRLFKPVFEMSSDDFWIKVAKYAHLDIFHKAEF